MLGVVVVVVCVLAASSTALNNGQGRTPPMGYSSWNGTGPRLYRLARDRDLGLAGFV